MKQKGTIKRIVISPIIARDTLTNLIGSTRTAYKRNKKKWNIPMLAKSLEEVMESEQITMNICCSIVALVALKVYISENLIDYYTISIRQSKRLWSIEPEDVVKYINNVIHETIDRDMDFNSIVNYMIDDAMQKWEQTKIIAAIVARELIPEIQER
jgi:hypothetical protein